MDKIYENIRARRIALGMTQGELSQKMGYTSTSTIAKIEAGKSDIPSSKLLAFATALDTSPCDLIGRLDRPKSDQLYKACCTLYDDEIEDVLKYISFVKTKRKKS